MLEQLINGLNIVAGLVLAVVAVLWVANQLDGLGRSLSRRRQCRRDRRTGRRFIA